MGKKKSLGSTPIGFRSNSTSYSFIRDIGVAEEQNSNSSEEFTKEERSPGRRAEGEGSQTSTSVLEKQKKEEPSEKMVVSYYLETTLVDRLKKLADTKGSYYSTVVGRAIRAWVERQNF